MQPQSYTGCLPFHKSIISIIIKRAHKGLSDDILQWGIFMECALQFAHQQKLFATATVCKTTLTKSILDIAGSRKTLKFPLKTTLS